MTVLDALKKATADLNSITIPVPMLSQIGAPISNAVGLVQAAIDALEAHEQQDTEEKEMVDSGTD